MYIIVLYSFIYFFNLFSFYSSFFPSSLLHQISVNNDILNFYHQDTSVRLSAIKSLKSTITDGTGTSSPHRSYDHKFFSTVLLSGLTDDEPTVVKQVLDMGEEVSHHFTCFVYTCTCTCIRCVHVHYVLGTFIYMYMYNLLYLNYNVHI